MNLLVTLLDALTVRGSKHLTAVRMGVALLCAAFVLSPTRPARAHASGQASEGCSGCHNGGKTPTVTVTADRATVNPGQLVTLTVNVSKTNGPVAGFFIETNGVGTLSVVDSANTKMAGTGITHTKPSSTPFLVGWTAPSTPGGVNFNIWANSANGDGKPSGDAEGDGFYSLAFGCAGTKYFGDYDGDGVGSVDSGYTINCSLPMYYATTVGDCNDNDPKINPNAPEICDGKDNNCDGRIDENLPIVTYCTDADGDGHGVRGLQTMTGCAPTKGFGLCDGDCNDKDPTVYPGAVEICNLKDDNCDGRVDENTRSQCGLGWCRRDAVSCGGSCTPGAPRVEVCNLFDDDCDGLIDNGSDLQLCGMAGYTCVNGACVVGQSTTHVGTASGDSAGTGGTSGAGSSSNTSSLGGSTGAGASTSTGVGAGAAGVFGSSGTSGATDSIGNGPDSKAAGCSVSFGSHGRYLAVAGVLSGLAFGFRRRRRRTNRLA